MALINSLNLFSREIEPFANALLTVLPLSVIEVLFQELVNMIFDFKKVL